MVEAEHEERQRDYEHGGEHTEKMPHWLRQLAPERPHQMASFGSSMDLRGMGLKIGIAECYFESNEATYRVGLYTLGQKCSSGALPHSC
jgi:hypothetical protein